MLRLITLVLLSLWAQEAAAFLPIACPLFISARPIVRAVPKSMPRVAARGVVIRAGTVVMQLLPGDETGDEKPAITTSAKQGTDAVGTGKEDVNYIPMASWFLVAILLMTNIHQQWTRALVFYIVSFKVPVSEESARLYMNIDLGFGEEQYALLASFGFTALFTVCRHVCTPSFCHTRIEDDVCHMRGLYRMSDSVFKQTACWRDARRTRGIERASQQRQQPDGLWPQWRRGWQEASKMSWVHVL